MQTEQPVQNKPATPERKIAVYTCITQGYDSLKIPQSIDERLTYYCFTDTPRSAMPPWVFVPVGLKGLSPKDQNRYIKMHPHEFLPEYDNTVYVDGNIQIVGEVYELVCTTLNSPEDIFLYQHPLRDCVYDEAAACAHHALDWIWTIASQMRRYSRVGYPVGNGLFEANVIIRKNTHSMRRFMDEWWNEYRSGANRDQLSLPFVAWRLGISLGSLGESDPRYGHHYFLLDNHTSIIQRISNIRKGINRTTASLVNYKKLFGLKADAISCVGNSE